jgi:hypothetical protein
MPHFVDAIIVILVAYLLFILQVTNYPIRCGNPNHLAGIRDEGVACLTCVFLADLLVVFGLRICFFSVTSSF